MLHVNLPRLVAREGGAHVKHAHRLVLLKLLPVKILCGRLARPVEEPARADLDTSLLLHHLMLGEGAPGREAGAHACHDDGGLVVGGEHDRGGLDRTHDGGAGSLGLHVGRAEAKSGLRLGRHLPVDSNDAQLNGVGVHEGGGGDRVAAGLDYGDHVHELVQGGAGRGEGLEDINVVDHVFRHVAVHLLALRVVRGQRLERLLLLLVLGEQGKLVVEAPVGLAVDIEDALKQLPDL
mmetsp:Transcript_30707/g.71755  ORF Transcript_30707/g.71755 Transcript_30707/m.71755 type:complete len:236 (+) Transcript_30707:615-1322(+)